MRSIFDSTTRTELIARVDSLSENSVAQWGKMNAFQMIKHCALFDEWVLGKNDPVYRQAFIGRLFGKMALKRLLKDDSPMKRNMPTTSDLKIKDTSGNIALEKDKWIVLIKEYEHYANPNFIHDFFGEMTIEQIGWFSYKHADHHLRQFSV